MGQTEFPEDKKKLHFQDGRIYFSRDTERNIFFLLTVFMLLLGAFFKLGVL
jgi:hypothetical protein